MQRVTLRFSYANCRYRFRRTLERNLNAGYAHIGDEGRRETRKSHIRRELDRSFANLNAISARCCCCECSRIPCASTQTHRHTCMWCVHRMCWQNANFLPPPTPLFAFVPFSAFIRNTQLGETATIFANCILTRSHSVFAPCARRTHFSRCQSSVFVCFSYTKLVGLSYCASNRIKLKLLRIFANLNWPRRHVYVKIGVLLEFRGRVCVCVRLISKWSH